MSPQRTDRLHFESQIAYARPVVALLGLLCLLELHPVREITRPLSILIAYFALSLPVLYLERRFVKRWRLPLLCDILVLGLLLWFSPSLLPAWFLFFFIAFTAGYRMQLPKALLLCAGLLLLAVLMRGPRHIDHALGHLLLDTLLVLAALTVAGGVAFLGHRSRRFTVQNELLGRLSSTMQVDLGLSESLRLLLEELCQEFQTREALLVYRDTDLERLFVWQLKSGVTERLTPKNLPLTRTEGFLLDLPDAVLCWNSLEGRGSGFGWSRKDGAALNEPPRIPGPVVQEFQFANLMTVTLDHESRGLGRVFLYNREPSAGPFSKEDLAWLEQISGQISPSLENVFLLRHLRARAIEAERSRISRDLHDGILQTLLSIEIQLDVLRRKVTTQPDQAETGLAALQQTVKNEGAELRHMVTDLKPLRVQSADLVDLMRGFAERFRNESTVALDLLVDSVDLRAPDRVCREVFQIYREALNNIKKHAKASHVVVKLSQDESRLVLVVDDNGEGFSFAGRFTGDELDRLRLGPISIKERTRTVGGTLTVESNPGHGARLTIEVPLG